MSVIQALNEESNVKFVSRIPSYYDMGKFVVLDTDNDDTFISASRYSNGVREVQFVRSSNAAYIGMAYPGTIGCEKKRYSKSGEQYVVYLIFRNKYHVVDRFSNEDDAAELFDVIVEYATRRNYPWGQPQKFSREVIKVLNNALSKFGNPDL